MQNAAQPKRTSRLVNKSKVAVVLLASISMLAALMAMVSRPGQQEASAAQGPIIDNTVCFSLDEGSGNQGDAQWLHTIDPATGTVTIASAATTTQGNKESIAVRNDNGEIWTYDPSTNYFYTIDPATGARTQQFATATTQDIDAMFFVDDQDGDPSNDKLYVIVDPATLRQVDIATQAFVGSPITITIPAGNNIEGATWVPATGQTYVVYTNTSSTTQVSTLATIDLTTGTSTDVGPTGIVDVEGLGTDGNGNLFATTGEDGPTGTINRFYQVDPVNGATTERAVLGNGGTLPHADFESVDCAYPQIGLAKAAAAPTSTGDGNWSVQYTFTVKNTGTLPLTAVTLDEDYALTVGGNPATGVSLVGTPTTDSDTCTAQTLNINQTCTIVQTATFSGMVPGTQYDNSASVSGNSPYSQTVTDVSHNGTDPDPENDGPGNNSDPTPATPPNNPTPNLGIVKTVVASTATCPANHAGGAAGLDELEIAPGTTVKYCISVINTGAGNATNVTVTDPQDPSSPRNLGTLQGTIANGGTPGETQFEYTVTQNTVPTTNTATAVGTDLDGNQTTPVSDQSRVTNPPAPSIRVIKQVIASTATCPADGDASQAAGGAGNDSIAAASGDQVKFCIYVKNNGPGIAENVVLSDDLNAAGNQNIGTLAVNAENVSEYTHTVGATLPEVNTATVNYTDTVGNAQPPSSDPASVNAITTPRLEIIKTVAADAASCPASWAAAVANDGLDTMVSTVGATVTYCINYRNAGDGDAQAVSISDDLNAAGAQTIGALAAGAEGSYNYTHTNAAVPETNTAIITGQDSAANSTTPDSDQAGVVAATPPALDIVKVAATSAGNCPVDFDAAKAAYEGRDAIVAAVGSSVTYCVFYKNTGAGIANDVSVTDAQDPSSPRLVGSLAPGASSSFHYDVTVATVPSTNTATIAGNDEAGTAATPDSDEAGVDAAANPNLQVIKTVVTNAASCPADWAAAQATDGLDTIISSAGATVTYCINYRNGGPGDAQNVIVGDNLNSAGAQTIGALAAGAEGSYNYTHTNGAVPETNTATIVGQNSVGDPATTDSDEAGVVAATPPQLEIIKSVVASTATCPANYAAAVANDGLDTLASTTGATVKYCINYRNAGVGAAQSVQITDVFDTQSPRDIGDLAAGAEGSFEYNHNNTTVPETNTARITGQDQAGQTATPDTDQAGVVAAVPPVLEVIKTVKLLSGTCPATWADAQATDGLDTIPSAVGATVKYCINYRNSGSGDAVDVTVTDSLNPAGTQNVGTLAAGAEGSYEFSHQNAAVPETNTATITGNDTAGTAAPSDSDTAGVRQTQNPTLEIIKTVVTDAASCPADWAAAVATDGLDTITAATGTSVVYCINYLNSGAGAASSVSIADDMNPANPVAVGDLAAGAEGSFNYTRVVAAEPETNTATITGQSETGSATTPDSDQAGTVAPGQATIGNFAWNDLNGNGIQDAGEPGLAGVTVTIVKTDAAGNVIETVGTQTTDANGQWTQPVEPGTYKVIYTAPNNGTFTTQDAGADDAVDSDVAPSGALVGHSGVYTVADGDTNLTIDAGITFPEQPAHLGNVVWRDTNGNGIQDAGEPGIPNVIVQVIDSSGNVIATESTDANGNWGVDVPAGTYTVKFINTTTGQFTTQDTGADDAVDSDADTSTGVTAPVTVAAGETNNTIDAGIVFPALIGDYVWQDNNNNGIQDAGEPGVAGVLVEVLDTNGAVVGSTTTDSNGVWRVDGLTPGAYTVRFNAPAGSTLTTANAGADDTVDSDADPTTGITPAYTLAEGEYNPTVDAGITPPLASIGDYVWLDTNGNGVQDAGEPGVQGVTATVYKVSDDSVAGTATTDANGAWAVTDLQPGDYYVVFNDPNGRTFTTQDANAANDANDSDAAPSTGRTGNYTLSPGENDTSVDAGLLPTPELASIGNYVWLDQNRDGVQDAGEPGVQGVTATVHKVSDDSVAGTATTDVNGAWTVTDLQPGDYYVVFADPQNRGFTVQDTNAANDTNDSDADPTTGRTGNYTLAAGENNPTVDAGITPPLDLASIGDYVWLDNNGNGVQDAGEPGVQGVTATVYKVSDDSVAGTATTDVNGAWTVTDLQPGDYYVIFTNLQGRSITLQDANAANDTNDSDAAPSTGRTGNYTLAAGENNPTVDLGLVPSPVIGLAKRLSNGPTRQDNGNYEMTFTFEIENLGPVALSNVALADDFNAIFAPDATVVSGPIAAGDGSVNDCSITAANGTATLDVGAKCTATWTVIMSSGLIPGKTYNNVATVTAQGPDGSPTNDIADDGSVVDENSNGNPNEPGENDPTPVTIPALDKAQIGDLVWFDNNANGVQDAGEPGVQGVTATVHKVSDDSVAGTATTDANGNWLVTDLDPGDYYVIFADPQGRTVTTQDAGADDTVDSDAAVATGRTGNYTLAAGDSNLTVDMGLIPTPVIGLAKRLSATPIRNQDGSYSMQFSYVIENLGPTRLSGITLSDDFAAVFAPGTLQTGPTPNAAGTCSLSALNGTLVLEPTGSCTAVWDVVINGVTPNTTYNNTATVTGTDPAGQTNTDVSNDGTVTDPNGDGNPGGTDEDTPTPVLIPALEKASLGDFVWLDTNQNGIQDAGEPGVVGVTVEALDDQGNVVGTTTTDAAGAYQIGNLDPGTYTVRFTDPQGRTLTTQDAGADDTVDSDVNPTTRTTAAVTLGSGEHNPTLDAGLIPSAASIGDYVWIDANANGIQDNGETPVEGVKAEVFDTTGNKVGEDTTNVNGAWLVDNLQAGEYYVVFTDPQGRTFTTQNAGADDAVDSDADPTNGRTGNYTLVAGEHNPTVDAGLLAPATVASIGDKVFKDLDGDGIQDADEPGIAGITVEVLDNQGNVVGTTKTAADGTYLVSDLNPGTYTVRFTDPENRVVSPQDAGTDDAVDSDIDPATRTSGPVTLAAGDQNLTVDAGLIPAPVIGLAKTLRAGPVAVAQGYQITYGFYVENLGEVTVENVKITDDFAAVFAPGTIVSGPIANSGIGQCSSTVLDGTQTLNPGDICLAVWDVIVSGLTPNTTYNNTATVTGTGPGDQTATDVSTDGTNPDPNDDGNPSGPGEDAPTPVLIPAAQKASLGDRVWIDKNGNGEQDNDEVGLAGVVVQIYETDANGLPDRTKLVATTTTDANGNYHSGDLDPGKYAVEFVAPGYTFTRQEAGTQRDNDSNVDPNTGHTAEVTLAAGEHNPTIDAGVIPPPRIGLAKQLIGTPTKNADGNYEMTFRFVIQNYGQTNLGTIRLTDDFEAAFGAGSLVSGPTATGSGADDCSQAALDGTASLAVGASCTVELSVTISGLTAGQTYENTAVVTGYSPAGTPTRDVSNDGTNPDSDNDGEPNEPGDNTKTPVIIPADQTATIGDKVFKDLNGDGVQDAGEPGVSGVTVNVLDPTGNVVGTTTTDNNGLWTITNLTPGDYTVQFIKPAGTNFSPQGQGTPETSSTPDPATGITATVTLGANETNNNMDAGLLYPSSIGDKVFEDTNANGVQDAGEPGVAGVEMVLYLADQNGIPTGNPLASDTTDADGLYLFEGLQAGRYVVVAKPVNRTITVKGAGTNPDTDSDFNASTGNSDVIVLAGDQHIRNVDLGLVGTNNTASVGDIVFEDKNRNGVQDAGEPGYPNVRVDLIRPDGTVVNSTNTDAQGKWIFTNVAPGEYQVRFTAPAGTKFTSQRVGDDQNIDSDANSSTGITTTFTLNAGDNRRDVDAGVVRVATVSPGDIYAPQEKYPGPFSKGGEKPNTFAPPAVEVGTTPEDPDAAQAGLAYTGANTNVLASLAIAMMAAGSGLVIAVRRQKEDEL